MEDYTAQEMRNRRIISVKALVIGLFLVSTVNVQAGPVYQPPGANLIYGDVTHGMRVQSASSNPAAAAADLGQAAERSTRGTVLSLAAGLEYGNVQNLFDFYDEVSGAYKPSDPGDGGDPDDDIDPDYGINLGDILFPLDPEFTEALDAIASEVTTQAALLALIKAEGYGKAWVAADLPFVLGKAHFGGAWTFGANWSGSSKAFGIVEAIEFGRDAARQALEDWVNSLPINRPTTLPIGDDIVLIPNPVTNAVIFALQNDSSLVTKATQTTELNVGYSRQAWSNSAGSLYLGAEARLYLMQLSRLSVRFGDITDSEELFESIRDSDFRNDTRLGIDVGALWVGDNYQLGAQVTNINEPKFTFPEVDLEPYRNEGIIGFLLSDQQYTMDRQFKFEASLFTDDRKWSAHLGYDADSATDPIGDQYQWLTLSGGFTTESWWIPGVRMGYRQNLAGTKMKYLGIGLTAFKIVNIDISSALNSVKIDGRELPQGLMASIGFQVSW
jgi:hypothetical protein